MSIGDVTGTSVGIKVGYISTFLIKPSQIVTSETTKEMEKEKRKCRFHDENDLMLFKDYSQANCKFECQLNAAYEKCHCVPWDYPHLNDSMAICDGYGRECFKAFMVKPGTQSFTSFMADLCQDINIVSSFSRWLLEYFLEGIAPLRHWCINSNEKSNKYKSSLLG